MQSQQQFISEKLENAAEPPEIDTKANSRSLDEDDYPEEFIAWVEEFVFSDDNLEHMVEEWEELFSAWILGTIMTVGEINLLQFYPEVTFDFIDDQLMDWMKWRANDSAVKIVGTTASEVRELIYDTLADGPYSIDKVQEALQKNYTFSDTRARSIARTEILTAQTTGQFASDMVFYNDEMLIGKYWQDSDDSKVRHSHEEADGQVREFMEPFDIGGEKMMFPRDNALGATAKNVIQCRCTYRLLWVGQEEKKAQLIESYGG